MFQNSTSGSTESLRLEDQYDRCLPWRIPIKSSGRGGAGNFHTTIAPNSSDSLDNSSRLSNSSSFSILSFRNPRFLSLAYTGNTKPHSKSCPRNVGTFGRGGAGNNRARQAADNSNKSSPLPDNTLLEQQYLLAHEAWRSHQPQSSGRGGAGNISLANPLSQAIQVLVSVTRR